MTLIGQAHGSVAGGAGSTNLGNFAISGLTIYDTLHVVMSFATTNNSTLTLTNTTDSVTVATFVTLSGNTFLYEADIVANPNDNKAITSLYWNLSAPLTGSTRSTFTTAYTGSWTLAATVDPIVATLYYSIRVFKIAGQ